MKAFLRKWIVPPGISQILADAPYSVKRFWGGGFANAVPLIPEGKNAASLHDLRTAPFGEVLWVDVEKVRAWGRALTWEQNQHIRYFVDGFESFRRFFDLHQPENQFESLMLEPKKVGEFIPVQFPRRRHPWSFESRYLGDGRLDFTHGPQEHGPVSNRKLMWEKKRLDRIRNSVEKYGLFVVEEDFIRFGELLIDDSESGNHDYRVLVVNALHRTSLLAYLGWSVIPMMPDFKMPWREIRLSDYPNWPGVLDGSFSEDSARAYFFAYFRNPRDELLSGW